MVYKNCGQPCVPELYIGKGCTRYSVKFIPREWQGFCRPHLQSIIFLVGTVIVQSRNRDQIDL